MSPLVYVAAGFFGGFAVTLFVVGLRIPYGYEDERGFHLGTPGKPDEPDDVIPLHEYSEHGHFPRGG